MKMGASPILSYRYLKCRDRRPRLSIGCKCDCMTGLDRRGRRSLQRIILSFFWRTTDGRPYDQIISCIECKKRADMESALTGFC